MKSKDRQKKPAGPAKSEIRALKKTELYRLSIHLLEITPGANRIVSAWIDKNTKKVVPGEVPVVEEERPNPNDELLTEYWDRVQSIRSAAKGACLTPLQSQRVRQRMNIIVEIIRTKQVSKGVKFALIDEMFREYRKTGAVFRDILIDTLIGICKKDEDWEYLIKKLEEKPGNREKRLVMDIYRYHLKDTDRYLQKLVSQLDTGGDYWELAVFYRRRRQIKKTLEIAEKGIAVGTGSLKELYLFLFDYYFSREDTANFQRISQAMIKQGRKEPELLERLFGHYRGRKDYAKAKDILLLWYESLRAGGQYDEYIRIRAYLKKMEDYLEETDWQRIGPEFLEYVKQYNVSDYLDFCWKKGMKKEVAAIISGVPRMKHTDSRLMRQCDEFAGELRDEYPAEMVEYYWKRLYKTVTRGKPQTVAKAVDFLKKTRETYARILKDEAEWKKRFQEFRDHFKNNPSFPHEEIKGL